MNARAGWRHSLAMYGKLVRMSLKAQLQYRTSLYLSVAGQFAISVVEFAGMLALFSRFGEFRGWSLAQTAFLYGLVNMAFPVADAISWGFDSMGQLVRTGNFDRLLVRPLSPVLQLFGMELTVRRIGRLAQGMLAFGTACVLLARSPDGFAYSFADRPLAALAAVVSLSAGFAACVSVFTSLFWIRAAFTFVTVEGLEAVNALTYGGQQAAGYPLSAYRKFLQLFFLAAVPVGAVIYLPACFALGKPGIPGLPAWSLALGPLAAIPFAFLARALWSAGLRRYASGGG